MSQNLKTDAELLALYLADGAQAPFEELIQRHGNLVYGICSRVLGRTHDAEDATQAVFLTLAHKASSLRNHPSVAGWLHRVAFNVAMRTKEASVRRASREREVAAMTENQHTPDANEEWAQIAPLLDTELDTLPEKYRLPIILHYIEGRTQEEVATLLGCTYGAISGRLNRAREVLRERLARRGVLLSSGLLFSLISQNASAAMPVGMAAITARAAVLIAAGNAAAPGLISAQAAALTQGALKIMFIKKVKLAAAAAVAVTVLCGLLGVAAYTALASEDAQAPAPPPVPAAENPAPQPAGPTTQEIAAWIKELEFKDTRIAAVDKLRAAGEGARSALEKLTRSDDAELRNIADTLLRVAKVDPTLTGLQEKTKAFTSVEAEMTLSAVMAGGVIKGTGTVKYKADTKQSVTELQLTVGGMNLPMKMVCDGKTIWQEVSMPTLGDAASKMVTKSSATSPELSGQEKDRSPLSLVEFRQQFDFTEMKEDVVGATPVYVFSGKRRIGYVEKQEKIGRDLGGEEVAKMTRATADVVDSGRIVVGKDDGILHRVEIFDAKGAVLQTVAFSNIRTNVSFADSAQFAYTPPPDVKVIDSDLQLKTMKEASEAADPKTGAAPKKENF
jgi:RNA polymerase sigma factor (sigma-70 family)